MADELLRLQRQRVAEMKTRRFWPAHRAGTASTIFSSGLFGMVSDA